MKIKVGPNINDITILARDGHLLVGKKEDGEWVNEIGLVELTFRAGANSFPTTTLECEVFGEEHELDVREEELEAIFRRTGVARITRVTRDLDTGEDSDANIHPDS